MHLDDTSRNRRIGIALISLTTLSFASLDAVAKWLVQDLPVFQVVWMRFVTHVLITALLLAPIYRWELVRVRDIRLQVLRGALLGLMTAMNFWALQYLQLAVGFNTVDQGRLFTLLGACNLVVQVCVCVCVCECVQRRAE